MNKAAIYCRVSTEGQEQDGTSLQTQLEACQKYCQARNYEVVSELSEAWSGLELIRPRLDDLRDLGSTVSMTSDNGTEIAPAAMKPMEIRTQNPVTYQSSGLPASALTRPDSSQHSFKPCSRDI